MQQGLYEQIINQITSLELEQLDMEAYSIGKEALDPEEARKVLAN